MSVKSAKKTTANLKPKAKAKPVATTPSRLQNLAARPASFDDEVGDDQLVDHSGVFRVTSAIIQGQIGHDEETRRMPSDSVVMRAQQDPFDDEVADAPAPEPVLERSAVAAAARAEKQQRLATLAARAQAHPRTVPRARPKR